MLFVARIRIDDPSGRWALRARRALRARWIAVMFLDQGKQSGSA